MPQTQLYEITSWFDESVLFSLECASLQLCVEAAVSAKVNLDRANLHGANLDGANLHGANLIRARLDGANLYGANLDGANLIAANLYGANLHGANLHGARLDGARLIGASLVRASLDGANLDGASLVRANLDGAKLDGASLIGARLIGASDIIQLGQPDGWPAYAYRAKTSIRVQIGCRNKTITEGRAYWAGKENRREVIAALDYAEKIAELREWTFEKETGQ